MKQLVQNYRTGELKVDEVPAPTLRPGGVLVQTIASTVSAGTEKSKVDVARKNLVGKALARPDQVRKVLDTLKKEGIKSTFNKVRSKLDALSPLGYSAAGRVLAVGDGCSGIAVGERVACAGAGFANHAEVIWVPANLCARIPDGVSFEEASMTTIGAIALQGVRQAEAKFGETVAVIGLGLIGQLTVQLLRAGGCRVVGIDIDPWKVELARASGAELAFVRDEAVVDEVRAFTDGRGVDAAIITAAAPTNDPLVLAGDLARERAHVVIVGALPLEIPRSPYYEKELDVRLSRSYGPGRYDRAYEEKGLDYPVGYVRWTENRNMQAFLQAAAAKQLALPSLITHRIPLADVNRAYDLISGEVDERFLGVVLQYADDAREPRPVAEGPRSTRPSARARIGFVGVGSFASGTLIPVLRELPGTELVKVCSASGLSARDAVIRHGFETAVEGPDEILDDPSIDTVFIASRHDTHASLTARALRAGKAVFVEKPLALSREELEDVRSALETNPALMVGFNRRYSPHTQRVRSCFAGTSGALVIHVRVNAGAISADSWIHDADIGGGRILGEVCHFVDLVQALADAPIKRVHAAALGLPDPAARLRDNVTIALELGDGSIANILYTSKGDMAIGKERIEVFGGGVSAVIDDFRSTSITRSGKTQTTKSTQDKGHRAELQTFLNEVRARGASQRDLEDMQRSTLATIAVLEALAIGSPIEL